ncbi:sulfatase-like hydrolase/transferase [Myxococcota bacterium]
MRFADVKAPAPWTVPTHATMFTGLLPSSHRAQWGSAELQERFQTLAEVLAASGFETVAFSSNQYVAKRTNMVQGFDDFTLVKGADQTQQILDSLPGVLDETLAKNQRLFLFLNLMDTHIPYNTSRYGKAFGVRGKGPISNGNAKWPITAGASPFSESMKRQHRAAYDAAVRYVDDATEAIFSLLRERNMLDSSLVVITSDHGEGLGDHQELGHSVGVWEEQLHVPLIIRLDGWRHLGIVESRTTLTGLMPSILDWLRVSRPASLERAPTVLDYPSDEIVADYRSYFSESNRTMNVNMGLKYPDLAARVTHAHIVYCGPHKLIVRPGPRMELYNLESDPTEQRDLAPTESAVLARCTSTYRALVQQKKLTPFAGDQARPTAQEEPIDPQTLRELGYIE